MQISRGNPLMETVFGNYELDRLLGQSQAGAAYLAHDRSQGERVLLTLLTLPEYVSSQRRAEVCARFTAEAARLVGLHHPHLLPIYDGGVQADGLYLVTGVAKDPSLSQFLKQQGSMSAQQLVPMLRQIASGLDYAHSQGVTHGMLSLPRLLLNQEQVVKIAGFGLRTMLEAQQHPASLRPPAHLLSPTGMFLGDAMSIAPEQVQGRPADTRADVYALGVIVFELLSGMPPFGGSDPLDVASQRLHSPIPSIHERAPQVPEGLDLILRRMLEPDPARRYQRAGEAALDFERALTLLDTAKRASLTRPVQQETTLPPSTNWFAPAQISTGKAPWNVQENDAPVPMLGSGQHQAAGRLPGGDQGRSLAGIDPFAWWSSQAPRETGTLRSQRKNAAHSPSRPRLANRSRRKLVTMIASGAVAAGVITVVGISFERLTQSTSSANSQTLAANTPTMDSTSGTTPAPAATRPSTKAQPTQASQKPTHTGVVIGATSMASNSARVFSHSTDGISSLLIHLANGQFVACERTCTHQGVAVNYDPVQKLIVCPAHGAVFDPANGFAHVSGPGQGPLTAIKIQTNTDGTVTAL